MQLAMLLGASSSLMRPAILDTARIIGKRIAQRPLVAINGAYYRAHKRSGAPPTRAPDPCLMLPG